MINTPSTTVTTEDPLVDVLSAELDAIDREYALDKISTVIAKVRLNFVANDIPDVLERANREMLEAKVKSVRATLI